ncbi:MAG: hypothetical protein ACRES1_03910, partial [Steroidobacteraceae bacterium]
MAPVSIPLGLISGLPFSPFSRAISSRSSAITRLCSAFSPSSFTTNRFSSARGRPSISGKATTVNLNQAAPRRRKQKNTPARTYAPLTDDGAPE